MSRGKNRQDSSLRKRYKIKYVCLKPIDYDLVKLIAGCLVFYGEVTAGRIKFAAGCLLASVVTIATSPEHAISKPFFLGTHLVLPMAYQYTG
jgi:hypothetical protein